MMEIVSADVSNKKISLETGRLARQASGSCMIRCGDTMVLCTAVAEKKGREGIDFFPLTCDYQEMTYAAGKIPGGFFKREGRPTERETLTSRLIDRPIRPLFPKGFNSETQIICTVVSSDGDNDSDILAITGASTALHISDIPFDGPIAAVRIGRVDGNLIVNPSPLEDTYSDLNLIVVAGRKGLVMVEGGADRIPEEEMLEATRKLGEKLRRKTADLEKETIETMIEHGLVINEVPKEAVAKWKAASNKGVDVLIGKAFSKEVYDQVIQHLEEFRKPHEN